MASPGSEYFVTVPANLPDDCWLLCSEFFWFEKRPTDGCKLWATEFLWAFRPVEKGAWSATTPSLDSLLRPVSSDSCSGANSPLTS